MYDRHNPFLASLKQIYRLNGPSSQKETYHIVLDITGSKIEFPVGDSVGVLPSHDPNLVKKTLEALGMRGDEVICDKRSGQTRSLKEHLTSRANITKIHSSLLEAVANKESNLQKREELQFLLSTGRHDELTAYLHSFELWDFLKEHAEISFAPQEICDLLPPLLPRFYSVASSLKMHPEEIHLTVATTDFVSRGEQRRGVGTHFLCRLATMGVNEVPIYVQSSSGFTLPQADAPIIMIGPGTGIAPFRAFLQERHILGSPGKNWLFYGECNEKSDFFYRDFWQELICEGKLRLDCAFSRDQEHKVYVQHKMLQNAPDLWQWLQDGAYLYVCGDAHKMAKDVDHILHEIVKSQGKLSEEETKVYIKALKKSKRYLRDVY